MADDDDDVVEHNTDAAASDATDPEVVDESATLDAQQKRESARANGLRVSVSVRTLLVTALIAALLASIGVLAWLYLGAKAQLDQQARQTANNRHAEQIALDYAVDAAKINYQDLGAWKRDLVKGTTRELADKLNGAAKSMEQILEPLQWNSTATPLVAKVRSDSNGIYVVDTFVGVETKTIQASDGLQSTATYSITIDSNHNWQISEVGGIGAVVEHK
jgi:Mce-associated membrane protein